jgi:hypothetical protein
MSQTLQEKNKALVLEAFDTLFNKRDYAAAERYWFQTRGTRTVQPKPVPSCSQSFLTTFVSIISKRNSPTTTTRLYRVPRISCDALPA